MHILFLKEDQPLLSYSLHKVTLLNQSQISWATTIQTQQKSLPVKWTTVMLGAGALLLRNFRLATVAFFSCCSD